MVVYCIIYYEIIYGIYNIWHIYILIKIVIHNSIYFINPFCVNVTDRLTGERINGTDLLAI